MFKPDGLREPVEEVPQQESAITENLKIENNAERTPERSLNKALMVEEKEANQDPVISSSWGKKAKEFFETRTGKGIKYTGIAAGVVAGGGLLWILKDFYFLFKFAKVFIEKGGRMTYADGKKIAEDAFSLLDGGKKKG